MCRCATASLPARRNQPVVRPRPSPARRQVRTGVGVPGFFDGFDDGLDGWSASVEPLQTTACGTRGQVWRPARACLRLACRRVPFEALSSNALSPCTHPTVSHPKSTALRPGRTHLPPPLKHPTNYTPPTSLHTASGPGSKRHLPGPWRAVARPGQLARARVRPRRLPAQ